MNKIKGVYAAMMTPFNKEGDIDERNTRKLIELLIEKGVDGLFPVSSIGESAILNEQESIQLMEITVDQVKGRVHVIPGATSTSVKQTRKLMNAAATLGCKAVVVAPPYYYPNTQQGLVDYYQAITEGININVIAYNIPLFTTPLSFACFEQLLKNKQIVGIKDSSGNALDFMNFRHLVKKSGRDDFSLLVGREEFFLGSLFLGADGCMVGTASIIPEALVAINKYFAQGQHEEAMKIQEKIVPLVQEMFQLPFPVGFKIGLTLRDIDVGHLARPLSEKEQIQYKNGMITIKTMMNDILGPFII